VIGFDLALLLMPISDNHDDRTERLERLRGQRVADVVVRCSEEASVLLESTSRCDRFRLLTVSLRCRLVRRIGI